MTLVLLIYANILLMHACNLDLNTITSKYVGADCYAAILGVATG